MADLPGAYSGALLLLGSPGSGKSTYCMQFAHDGLLAGETVVYVTTDDPPSQIRQTQAKLLPVVAPEVVTNNLRIVDCYSWRVGVFEEPYSITNPNLSELSLLISKAREGISNFRFILDSTSSIALESSSASLIKFLQVTYGRLKAAGGKGLFAVEAGAHDPSLINYMRFVSDGVIEMSLDEGAEGGIARRFRIFCLRGIKHSTGWVPFSISDEGVKFKF